MGGGVAFVVAYVVTRRGLHRTTTPAREANTGRRWRLSGPPTVGSGGGGRPRRACLILALACCSPVLVPVACFSFPLFCIVGLCLRGGRRKTPGFKEGGVAATEAAPALEERLLPRYLEDQLRLVSDVYALDGVGDTAGD